MIAMSSSARNESLADDWRRQRHMAELPDLSARTFADYLQPLTLLTLNTGIRRGEALQLKWTDVDLVQRKIVIRGDNAKSGKTRHVPLNDEALTTLQHWKTDVETSEWVFPGPRWCTLKGRQNILEERPAKSHNLRLSLARSQTPFCEPPGRERC